MKKIYISILLLISIKGLAATKYWDGGGDGVSWNSAANWFGDIIPTSTDDVILDNTYFLGTYIVTLPIGSTTVSLRTIFNFAHDPKFYYTNTA